MNKDEQNKAIAEACGLVPCKHWQPFMPTMLMKGECGHEKCYPAGSPANYTESLQAMHEAEKTLKPCRVSPGGAYPPESKLWDKYVFCLLKTAEEHNESPLHASAEVRAEAFLRTLNLWHPAPPRTDDL